MIAGGLLVARKPASVRGLAPAVRDECERR
jgi:hypothetical protein